jgi:hypothetical protein
MKMTELSGKLALLRSSHLEKWPFRIMAGHAELWPAILNGAQSEIWLK